MDDFRRRLSSGGESFSEGTSRFFSSVIAKKNGLMNDLSNKIESVGATLIKASPSGSSISDPESPTYNQPTDFNQKPKSLKDYESSKQIISPYQKEWEDDSNYGKKTSPDRNENLRMDKNESMSSKYYQRHDSASSSGGGSGSEDTSFVTTATVNMSFDEPLYTPGKMSQAEKTSTSASGKSESWRGRTTEGRTMTSDRSMPAVNPAGQKTPPVMNTAGRNTPPTVNHSGQYTPPANLSGQNTPPLSTAGRSTPPTIPPPPYNPNKTGCRSSRSSTNSPKMSSGHSSDSEKYISAGTERSEKISTDEKIRAPTFASTKRRSSTVDEMLFDDYVDPVQVVAEPEPEPEKAPIEDDNVFNKRKTLLPMGDLISFDEPELEDFHPRPLVNRRNKRNVSDKSGGSEKSGEKYSSVSSMGSSDYEYGENGLNQQTSVESSEPEYERSRSERLGSMGSTRSWSSNYSLDSQPDDLTVECMGFMKQFVDKIFNIREDITQMEKAKFGEYCQQVPGRQWFARYVNSQRVVSRKVEESIFFRLVQYFAVVLFECNEAEDYVPAKNLMNMCFTFYQESRRGKQRYKTFLYTFLKEQPIWQSLRFWNAAFFDAVQNERARKPVCTSEDGHDSQTDDSMFQENITFGQLGTFTCNMRAFGLSKELCLEFLRKQSTIADMKGDQIKMLKDNIDKWKDH